MCQLFLMFYSCLLSLDKYHGGYGRQAPEVFSVSEDLRQPTVMKQLKRPVAPFTNMVWV